MATRRMLLMVILLVVCTGCNKEKATAVKLAAEQFRQDAVLSLSSLGYLMNQNMSVAIDEDEDAAKRISNDILLLEDAEEIDAELLTFWSSEATLGDAQAGQVQDEIEKLKKQYYLFEEVFTSLDKGSLFAKESVRKCEKHALDLTLQLVNISKMMLATPYVFASRRVVLIEQMKAAWAEENPSLRKELVNNLAKDFIVLRATEKEAKEKAVTEMLQAVSSGKTVLELIKNYEKLSVNDVLSSIKNTLAYSNSITNGASVDIVALMGKFDAIESTIEGDPYWSVLLTQTLVDPDQNR